MDMQLTDEQILEISKRIGPTGFATPTHTYYGFTQPRLLEFARALLSQQVEAARNAAQWVSVKERLPAPLLAFDDWLNAPPSREVTEPTEVRIYRFEAYRRWQEALTAVRALASSPAEQKGNV